MGATEHQFITPDLLVIRHAFAVMGMPLGKTTVAIRMTNGRVLVHSAGPLDPSDIAAIHELGEVQWLMEANRIHDTFAQDLRAAFPEATYALPAKFPISPKELGPTRPLREVRGTWSGDLEVMPLRGAPRLQEHVCLHRPSRSLILGDLVFNLPISPPQRVPLALRVISGLHAFPGTSRLVKWCVKDRAALQTSINEILAWDFDRVIFSHGVILDTDAKAVLSKALSWATDAE
ncbi:MAG: hypothetical protein SynsKO_19920 [Synoicihabitans sp.]